MTVSVAPDRAPLQLVGVCGQTIAVIVNGAAVTFTCLPATSSASPGTGPVPHKPAPPNAAALLLDATDLTADAMPQVGDSEDEAEVVTIDVSSGSEVSADRLRGLLSSARDAGQVPRIRIR